MLLGLDQKSCCSIDLGQLFFSKVAVDQLQDTSQHLCMPQSASPSFPGTNLGLCGTRNSQHQTTVSVLPLVDSFEFLSQHRTRLRRHEVQSFQQPDLVSFQWFSVVWLGVHCFPLLAGLQQYFRLQFLSLGLVRTSLQALEGRMQQNETLTSTDLSLCNTLQWRHVYDYHYKHLHAWHCRVLLRLFAHEF